MSGSFARIVLFGLKKMRIAVIAVVLGVGKIIWFLSGERGKSIRERGKSKFDMFLCEDYDEKDENSLLRKSQDPHYQNKRALKK